MTEKWKDTLKAITFIILLTFVNLYVPFLSLIAFIIWPIPVVLVTIKHGMNQAAMVIAAAALVNGAAFSPIMGLFTVVGFGFIGFVLGGCVKERFEPLKTLILTIIAVLASQLLILGVAHYLLNFDFSAALNEVLETVVETPQIGELMTAQLKEMIWKLSPAMLVVAAATVGTLNYYITLGYLNYRGYKHRIYRPVRYWYFPRWFVSLGILVTLLFNNTLFSNLNVLFFFLAFVQGFGVGLYYLNKKGSIFLTFLYIMLVFTIPLSPFILILLGLFDLWFDFRKIQRDK
ncbi:MAG: DUF2232 domain-containing protein [Bacillota bacterium]